MSYAVAAEPQVPVSAPATPGRRSHLSAWQVRTGRILSGIAVLFLIADAAMKVFQLPVAMEGTVQIGYPAGVLLPLGIVQIACLVLYLVPRTAPFGAAFWTAYLGGAVATHVRVADPLFSHVLFPTYVATLLWVGLWLRDARVRVLTAPRIR